MSVTSVASGCPRLSGVSQNECASSAVVILSYSMRKRVSADLLAKEVLHKYRLQGEPRVLLRRCNNAGVAFLEAAAAR